MKKDYCKVCGKTFHYDREHGIVEQVTKATKDMCNDNAHWQEKYGNNLWDINADGYFVMASAGLRAENWDNREVRTEYLAEWADELDEETAYLVESAIKEGRKEIER